MPGYDWRTSGESAGGTSYPVSSPSQPLGRDGPPSVLNPPPQVTTPVVPGGYVDPGGYDEKTDYFDETYVSPQTGKTVKTMQDEAYAASQAQEAERMRNMKEAMGLGDVLRGKGIQADQLTGYMESGVLPGHIAVQGGMAKISGYDSGGNPIYVDSKTGKPYDPRGMFTPGMAQGLKDMQFMQDEGVYGGVSGMEAEVNKQKGSVVNAIGKMKTQGLSPDQIKRRLGNDPTFQSLTTLFGDADEALLNTVGFKGMKDEGFWDEKKIAEFQANPTQTWGDVGYDPTGVHTWSEIESDPVLYEKYLKRGTLWDDPLSGTLKRRDARIGEGGRGRQPQRQMSQRERNLALLRFLQGGSPIKQLEQSGFMGSMKDPYAEPMKIAGEKGIFSGISGTGITGEAMRHLLKSWGSGYSSPRYANVARGGIMSAWNDMRR